MPFLVITTWCLAKLFTNLAKYGLGTPALSDRSSTLRKLSSRRRARRFKALMAYLVETASIHLLSFNSRLKTTIIMCKIKNLYYLPPAKTIIILNLKLLYSMQSAIPHALASEKI